MKRFGTCSKDCYGGCVFEGEWNDDAPEHKLINAHAIKDHPFTQGMFCAKLNLRQHLIYHPSRLRQALERIGPKGENSDNLFQSLQLSSAVEKVAEKVRKIQAEFGSRAIAGAFYAQNVGLLSMHAPIRFFDVLKSPITSGGICNEGGIEGLKSLFGTYSTVNPFQIVNPATKLIIVWGSNLSANNIHAYTMVKQALKNGAILVVIDSRKTQIAKEAHYYLEVSPGFEFAIAELLLSYIVTQNAYDMEFLSRNADNVEGLFSEIRSLKSDEMYQKIGISPHAIQELGNLLLNFKHHTLFLIGYGVQKYVHGGWNVRTIALIQIMLGNVGKPGTGIIYSQSGFNSRFNPPILDYITRNSVPLPTISLIHLGKALETDQIKLLFIWNFDPAASLPNQIHLRKLLSRSDLYIVVIDTFHTQTTAYADLVIPAKFDVETDDIFTSYYIPGISINQGGPCPYPDCVTPYEFFQKVAKTLKWTQTRFNESQKDIVQICLKLLPPYMQNDITTKGYSLLFKSDDLPYADLKFPTPTTHIQLVGPHFNFRGDLLSSEQNRKPNEFFLITPSHPMFIHSQLGESHPEVLTVFDQIFLNPADIHLNKFEPGTEVIVKNSHGEATYTLSVSTQLKQGVAMIYSGPSSTRSGHPNANFFTSDEPEILGHSGSYNGARVFIAKKV